MGDILKSAHELVKEQEERAIKKQMTHIKRLISKQLKDMSIDDLALVNQLIIHRSQIKRYFELHKALGRQIG
jgi:transcription termination factor NusB